MRQNNALYAPPFADAEDAASLPRVRREHITLTKFLGKGAFGEVYEGLAQQLPGQEECEDGVRVAIKVRLRTGGSRGGRGKREGE